MTLRPYINARSSVRGGERPAVCPGCCPVLIRSRRAVAAHLCDVCRDERTARAKQRVAGVAGVAGVTALALLVFILLALFAVELCAEEDRTFHPCEVATIAALPAGSASVPTHVRLTGWITYKKVEADGDVHLRMSDGDAFVVLEAIPELPEIAAQARAVRVWTKVTVWGISRYDGWPGHGFWEIHPVLGIEVAK